MPNTPKRMSRTSLTTANVTIYTVPAATTAIVTEIIINNTTAGDITPTVLFGGAEILSGTAVPGNGMITIGMKQILTPTETIVARATAAGLNIFIAGVEVT